MRAYETVLHKINNNRLLSREELFTGMMSLVELTDPSHVQLQMGMILFGLSVKKPTVDEVLGLWDFVKDIEPTLLKRKLVANVNGPVIGLSGSGKKGIKTFNISTPAAIVAATAGAYVSKPVSKATSSMTGSSDLLQIAGASLNINHVDMLRVLEDTGLGAFSIESTIPAFDQIYGGKFFAPHALSHVLAAMVNPVNCSVMMHGLTGENIETSAQALKTLGIKRGAVMCSSEDSSLYVDEITPLPKNALAFWDEDSQVKKYVINVSEVFGCGPCTPQELEPGLNKQYQLKIFLDCLRGRATEVQISTVAINSALIIMNSGLEANPKKAYQIARDVISSGKAEAKLENFCNLTQKISMMRPEAKLITPELRP